MAYRILTKKIEQYFENENIFIIEGPYGVGKTSLMQEYEKRLDEQDKEVLFIDVEEKRYSKELRSPGSLIEFIRSHYPIDKKIYLFIDGVQYLKNPINFISVVYSSELDLKIIVSTFSDNFKQSNEYKQLKDKIDTYLLYSLSWQEYLNVKSGNNFERIFNFSKQKKIRNFYQKYKAAFEERLPDFLQWGSYPKVVKSKTNKEQEAEIQRIFHQTIEQEISGEIKEENLDTYLIFLRTLAKNIGQALNRNKISKQLDIHKRTVARFVEITSSHFLFSFLQPFYTNSDKEISKMLKIYGNDFGVINYLAGNRPPERLPVLLDESHILNFVFHELCTHRNQDNVYFYRTIAKAEIDFIFETNSNVVPVEINYQENNKKSSVVLKNFVDNYQDSVERALIITKDKLEINGLEVYLPLPLIPFVELR
jgi:predicted AAA+ superfamily ATPase